MKIMIISDAWEPQLNGVVRTYQNIIRELEAMGHEVRVIGPAHFQCIPLPGYGEIKLALFPYRKMCRLIGAYKPDAIHISVEASLGWAARRYCLRRKVPFTTSYHTMFPDYMAKRAEPIFGTFIAKLIRKKAIAHVRRFHRPAKATYVATDSLEKQLRRWRFKQPMVRLVRGVDPALFSPGVSTVLDHTSGPRLLYVGRVAIEKNIEAFLDLTIQATKIVVGDGPSLDVLKKKYPDVHFVGVKTGAELVDYYRACDVFVFPSRTDTFGIVLIEALACGLPLAGYNVTGPKDIITHAFLGAVDSQLEVAVQRALALENGLEERVDHARKIYSWKEVARIFLNTASSQ